MDTNGIIAADSAEHLLRVVFEGASSLLEGASEAYSAALASPRVQELVSGVIGMEEFCGPRIFVSIVVFVGGFMFFALGAAFTHHSA